MPPKLPQFEPGSRLGQIPAHEWRALVEAVRRRINFVAGPGMTLTEFPGGVRFGLSETPPVSRPAERTVVVTVEPQTGAETVTVRQVRYADIPPEEHKYVFDGNDFEAYPDLGYAAKDYKSYHHDPEEEMDEATQFLRAEKRRGVWLLRQSGGGNTDGVVIRRIENEDGFSLFVQRVTLNDAGEWAVAEGTEEEELPTWPNVPAGWWEYNRLPEGNPSGPQDVVPTRFVGGVEVVEQWFPEKPVGVRSDDPHSGCRPMGV